MLVMWAYACDAVENSTSKGCWQMKAFHHAVTSPPRDELWVWCWGPTLNVGGGEKELWGPQTRLLRVT